MTDLLTVKDLAVTFDAHGGVVHAVRGVNLRVRPGGTVALVGESGSGKTVVSQAIMRILPESARIDRGQILFADPDAAGAAAVDLAALPQDSAKMRAIRGARMSIIFQEPMTSLSPLHTIGDQVSEALRQHRDLSGAESRKLTAAMLRLVGFPSPERALKTYPFELSGGLRQRAMIAMALICRPALLIADEPTTALDVTIQAQILKLMKDLQTELRMAVLIITHDLGVVANVAEEVVVMYHGEVMEAGTLADIFGHPTHPYLRALFQAVPRFHMKKGERLVPIREIKGATGHLLAGKEGAEKAAAIDGPLVRVKGISKTYTIRKAGFFGARADEAVLAVDDVSFEIYPGECLGLVGESGCGKTTLSKVLMRALKPDCGEVVFNDKGKRIDVLALSGRELVGFRRKIQFIFQDPFSSLNPRMTVSDIIAEPLVIHGIGDAAWRAEMVRELIELVGLDVRHLNRYPHSFSGGQRQRIGIARALALRPELLICDEPVSALDVSVQAQILNLLQTLREKLGLTYMFISHNLAVVDYVSDRIAVMCAGRLVEIAPRDILFRDPVHPYTKALLAAVPYPDPERQLDFGAVEEGKASVPEEWPAPFTLQRAGGRVHLVHIGEGHFVRMAAAARAKAIAS